MRIRLVAAAVAVAGALAGCSDSQAEPQTLPPVSPAASPSPVPTLLPLPSPSLQGKKADVEKAMLDYYRAINLAFATGDITSYSATHTGACEACKKLTELLRSTTAKGQRFEGAQDQVLSYAIPDVAGPNAVADVRFRVTPYSLVDSQGAVLETYEPTEQHNVIAFNLIDGAWKVVGVTKLDD